MQFPDRIFEIQLHKDAAHRYRAAGDFAQARSSYNKWVESVKQQNINNDGQLDHDLDEAEKEFSEFVRTDPLYQQICNVAIAKIRDTPGIFQTDLYKALTAFDRTDVTYVMYFAGEHGVIIRTKKGRTYSLSLP